MSEPRTRGRPRVAGIEDAVLRAAAELLAEQGAVGLTIAAVAERSGVARATVYRRYPTREALVGAAARTQARGRTVDPTGDIATDIRTGAMFIQRILESPIFTALMPEMIRGLVATPRRLDFDLIGPSRPVVTKMYLEHAAEQGFDPDLPANFAYDLTAGALWGYLLATGTPPTAEYAQMVAGVVIRGLTRRDTDEAGPQESK
jgi:AcrR family transcriptional regulator